MANPEHLRILKRGNDAWEQWRLKDPLITPDLSRASLSEQNLGGTNLSRVNLSRASLTRAHLTCADFTGADLSAADLSESHLTLVDFSWADLRGANLSRTWISGTDFSGARLTGTSFQEAGIKGVKFGNTDLSTVKGLETLHHYGPSTIGIDTIYKSKGNIPEAFLRGCGVAENFIVYMKSLARNPIEFYSCFISYSSQEDAFAQRLYADLQAKNVRCWKFDENAKWGEPVWGEIDTAIRHYDKLVVICSKDSLQSPPVIREIERALQKEDREHKNVLFPVRIDDYLFDKWDHPRKADAVSKVAGDFRGWENHAIYSEAFPRFLDALNWTCPHF